MVRVFTDGGFATRQCFTSSPKINFVTSFLVEALTDAIIGEHQVNRCPPLRHYGNLAELVAVREAARWLRQNIPAGETIEHVTDSMTIKGWMGRAILNKKAPSFATVYHEDAWGEIQGIFSNYQVEVKQVPRDLNKAGWALEERYNL